MPAGARPWSLPIHPAQLYATVDAAILAWLAVAFTPLAKRDGGCVRPRAHASPDLAAFLLEMIRIDEAPALGTPFSISQVVAAHPHQLGGGTVVVDRPATSAAPLGRHPRWPGRDRCPEAALTDVIPAGRLLSPIGEAAFPKFSPQFSLKFSPQVPP